MRERERHSLIQSKPRDLRLGQTPGLNPPRATRWMFLPFIRTAIWPVFRSSPTQYWVKLDGTEAQRVCSPHVATTFRCEFGSWIPNWTSLSSETRELVRRKKGPSGNWRSRSGSRSGSGSGSRAGAGAGVQEMWEDWKSRMKRPKRPKFPEAKHSR